MRLYKRSGRPDAVWWFAFHHRGKPVRKSAGTADREAAQEYADHYRASLWRADKLGERPAVAWDVAALAWLEAHQHLRSIRDRRDHLRWAQPHLTGKPLASIDRAALAALARRRESEGASSATANRYLASISAVLGYAVTRGWLDAAPRVPRRPEAGNRLLWATRVQAECLLRHLPPHLAAMARFSLATGLRRGNVTGLTWQQVDLRQRLAWVAAEDAKGGRTLRVPLNADAMAVLRAQRGKDRRLVFPYNGRQQQRTGNDPWRAACKAAGLTGFRWHDLRHTWASWHVQAGTPLAVLQELGGWRSAAMVQRYAHLAPSHVAGFAGNSALKPAQNRGHAPHGTRGMKAA